MTSVEYNPAARFDVSTTDVVYLGTGTSAWRLPSTGPGAKVPSRAWWTFTVADGS